MVHPQTSIAGFQYLQHLEVVDLMVHPLVSIVGNIQNQPFASRKETYNASKVTRLHLYLGRESMHYFICDYQDRNPITLKTSLPHILTQLENTF